MRADETREAAADKAAEKTSESGGDRSPIKADDVMSAQSQAADNYKTDLAKRAEEYALGKDRGTGSQKWLPSSLEIVDGLKKLVGKITRAITRDEILPAVGLEATVTPVQARDGGVTPAEALLRGRAAESGIEAGPEAKPETSRVTRDDQNRPAEIQYPDGKTNRIEYDKEGSPTVLHARDGSTLVREGDHWNINKDGKNARWDGNIDVSENGDITLTRHDGHTKVRHVDGSESITEPADKAASGDHSVQPYDKQASGDHSAQPDDKLASGDHSVQPYDKLASGDHSVQPYDKLASGDHPVATKDTSLAGADQAIAPLTPGEHKNPDGSLVTIDQVGHVTHTKDAKGHERSFEYDEQGRLVKVLDHGTATWETKDGIHWTSHDGRTWEGTISVGSDGTYQYTDSKGNQTIEKTDGTSVPKPGDQAAAPLTPGEHKYPDGSSVTVDDQGHVTKTVDAKGDFHEFKYGTIMGPDGKQTTAIVEVKDEYGVWKTKDGTKWEREKDGSVEQWKGTINVSNKGDYIYQDGKGVHIEQLDGKKVLMHADGSTTVESKDGHMEKVISPPPANKVTTLEWKDDHISKIVYPDGKERKFEYNDVGELNKVTELDGTVWSTKDSATAQDKADPMSAYGFHIRHVQTWTSSDGKTWAGNISVDEKGNYKYIDEGGTVTVKSTDGKATCTNSYDKSVTVTDADGKTVEVKPPVDRHAMEVLAEQLHKESGADVSKAWLLVPGGVGAGIYAGKVHTDRDLVLKQLSGLTEAQREVLRDVYKQKYGKSLESEYDFLDGSDKTKFLAALYKKEESDVSEQSYERIKAAIETAHELSGDSKADCEKKIRSTLAVMNSDDIQQMLKDHPDLRSFIVNDSKLSDGTKQICDILLKGKDRISDDDYFNMANIAIKEKNLDAFQEVMALASPEARKRFLDAGGEQKVKDAFGESTLHKVAKWALIANPLTALTGAALFVTDTSDKDTAHAKDYAKEGKLSAAQQIIDNTGYFFNNSKGIENALNDMTQEERKEYLRGKELTEKNLAPQTDEDKKAKEYYDKLHGALNKICRYTHDADMARWEDLIATKGGGLIAKIGAHRGSVYNDSKGDVIKDIENIPKEEWERLHNLKQGKNADGSEPKNEEEKKHNVEQYQKYHDELQKALYGLTPWAVLDKTGRFTADDARRAIEIFDKKMDAKDFAASQEIRRSLEEALNDDTHWYKSDRQALYQDIAHMTKEEQEKYRTDPAFRTKVDAAVTNSFELGPTGMSCPGLDAAKHMLDNIMHNKPPEDIISKLDMHAQNKLDGKIVEGVIGVVTLPVIGPGGALLVAGDAATGGSGKDALFASGNADPIRDIQQALRDDPSLRDRILHPQTDADKQLAAEFSKAAHAAMGSDTAYDAYVKPLLETGFLPMEAQAILDKGIISNDKEGALKDVSNIAQLAAKEKADAKKEAEAKGQQFDEKNFHGPATNELNKILNDKDYQEKALGFLSDDDRKVALAVLQNPDGQIHPEDSIKLKLNHIGGSDEIMAVLHNIPPAELDRVRAAYLTKYGSDLETDLLKKCTSSDQTTEITHMFAKYSNATDAYFSYLDDVCKSKSGFGAWFTEHVGQSGTGYQLDDVMNKYTKELAEAHGQFKELSPQKQAELQEQLTEALKNWKESKSAAAEYTVDAIIAVIAVAGAAYTGGGSLGLLSCIVGSAGAISNVAIKQAMLGGDYDWDPAAVAKDILSGSVNGVANVLGPGEMAALFKVGEKAAVVAAEQTVKQLGEKLLQEGAEKALQKGMQDMMGNALAHGAKDFSKAEIEKLAEQAVAKELTGEAKEQAIKQIEQTIKKNLEEQLKKETANWLKQTMLEAQLNMAGGAMGGGAGGFTTGAFQWDGTKSVEENLKMIGLSTASNAAMGAVFAGLMTIGIKAGQKGLEKLKPLFEKGTPEVVINGKEVPVGNITGPQGHVTTVEGTAFGTTGKGDVEVMNTGTSKTTIVDAVGHTTELKPGETMPLKPGDTVLVGDPPHPIELKEGASVDKPPVIPDKPDAVQIGIKEGQINPDTAKPLPKSGSGIDAYEMELQQPDGTTKKIIFRVDQVDEFAQRVTNDKAGYKLNQMLGLDNGMPATELCTAKVPAPGEAIAKVEFDPAYDKYKITGPDGKPRLNDEGLRKLEKQLNLDETSLSYSEGGKLVHEVKGWAQEAVGQDFHQGLAELAKQRYGSDSNEAILRLMKEDPEIKKAIETAMVERILLGDADMRDGNFRLVMGPDGKYHVENIDLDLGFKNYKTPTETDFMGKASVGVTEKLAQELSDQPLTPELRKKIANFVKQYDNQAGRAELAKLGLNAEQIDAYLARAKYMAENGKFPHIEHKDLPGTPAVPPKAGGGDSTADLPPEKPGDLPPDTEKPADTIPMPPDTEKPADTIPMPPDTEKPADTIPELPPETVADKPVPVDTAPDVAPNVKKILDNADIPLGERAKVLDLISKNELAQPALIESFVKDVKEPTSSWLDAMRYREDFTAAEAQCRKLEERYHKEVILKLNELRNNGTLQMSEDELRKFMFKPELLQEAIAENPERFKALTSDPDKVQLLDDFAQAKQGAEHSKNLYQAVKEHRVEQLQAAMDKFAEEHHLPKVEVKAGDAASMQKSYGYYKDGAITINEKLILSNKNPAELMETLYHEFVHSEQDTLIIRHLADNLNIGEHADPKQILELKQAYQKEVGGTLSDKHLEEVLSKRKGQALSDEQTQIAKDFIHSFKDIPNTHLPPEYGRYEEELKVCAAELQKLYDDPNESMQLLDKLSKDDGMLSQKLFGTKVPPPEVTELLALRALGLPLDIEDVSTILRRELSRNYEHLNYFMDALYKQYSSSPHEIEAFILGATVGRTSPYVDGPVEVKPDVTPKASEKSPATDLPPETKKTGDVPSEQPPETKKSADSQSGVNEVLDKAGIKSEDRPAVLDQIHKENPLARPEVKEPYVQSMRDLTSKWDELTKLAQDADGIDKRYFDLRPKSEKTINQLVDAGLSQETAAKLLRNPEKLPELAKSDPKLAELLAHNPEQAQVLNDFAKAAVERKQMNVVIQERAAELQKVMDQLADSQKPPLPHTRILIGDDSLVPPGKTNYADGVIAINRKDILANNDPARFTEQLYHEFVHSEQDNLIIRNLTDQLEKKFGHPIGQPPSAEELQELAKAYEANVGTPPDEFHLTQVLEKRNGEPLTPEQAIRAEELAEAFKNNQPPGPRGEIVKKDLESCTEELRKLGSSDHPEAGKELLDKLSKDNGSLAQSLFGEHMPPEVEQLLQKYRATGQVSEQEAREVLQQSISNHKLALDGELADMRKAYYGPKHELEAWVIGKEVKADFEKAPLTGDQHAPIEPAPETKKTGEGIGDQPPETKKTGEATPEAGKQPTEAPPENQSKLPKEAAEDPTMNWAEISEETRLEMVQRAKRSELYKPEVVDHFVNQSKEITSKWGDESHVLQNLEASRKQLVGAYASVEHDVQDPLAAVLDKMGKSREEIQQIINSTDEMRKLLSDEGVRKLLESEEIRKLFPHAPSPEEKLKLVDDYVKARDAFGEAQGLKDAVVKERTEQIQKLYDQFADEHGLPRVKVTLKDEVGAGGTYTLGKGEIHINESTVLANKDPAKLADTMLHEFVHNEQDFVKVRYLAEELAQKEPVGYPPSVHTIDQLQLDYEIRTGIKLDPKYLDEVLRVNEINRLEGMYAKETGQKLSREQAEQLLHLSHDEQIKKLQEFSQGKLSVQQAELILDPKERVPMTEAEKARANEMLDDAIKHPFPGDTVAKYEEDNAVAASFLRRLDADPEAYKGLLEDLAQDQKLPPDQRVLTHRLFGGDNPPEDVLRMLDPSKTLPWEPNRLLKESIQNEIDIRKAWMRDAYRDYFANPDEQEAWLIGKRAAIASREAGVPGSDLPPETVKDLDPHPERKTLPGLAPVGD